MSLASTGGTSRTTASTAAYTLSTHWDTGETLFHLLTDSHSPIPPLLTLSSTHCLPPPPLPPPPPHSLFHLLTVSHSHSPIPPLLTLSSTHCLPPPPPPLIHSFIYSLSPTPPSPIPLLTLSSTHCLPLPLPHPPPPHSLFHLLTVSHSPIPHPLTHSFIYSLSPSPTPPPPPPSTEPLSCACRLKPLDIEFMKQLHNLVNIIPVIAKADTLTPREVKALKIKV